MDGLMDGRKQEDSKKGWNKRKRSKKVKKMDGWMDGWMEESIMF